MSAHSRSPTQRRRNSRLRMCGSSCTVRPAFSTTRGGRAGSRSMRRMWSFWMPAWDDDGQLVTDPQPLITRKKVILKNDCIHHVVDIYHI